MRRPPRRCARPRWRRNSPPRSAWKSSPPRPRRSPTFRKSSRHAGQGSSRRTASRPTERALEARGWIARRRAHLPGRRHFEDLHLVRGADLVVAQVSGNEKRIALLDADRAAILEFEIDPAFQHVDELAIALVIVPAGGPAHALARRHDLGAQRARAGVGDAEVAILEEVTTSLDQYRFGGAGVSDLLRGHFLRRRFGARLRGGGGWHCFLPPVQAGQKP